VEVDIAPESIPKHVMIGNKKVKINKNLYMYLWANIHATSDGRKKIDKIVM
jgi:hypothetical protein